MSAYDNVIAVLEANGSRFSTRTATGAQAQCPAHSDRTPSLSVTARDDRVLIYCHAGCHSGEVLAALGLTYSDLYDAPRAGTWRMPPLYREIVAVTLGEVLAGSDAE
jgi:hypothetical protein